MLKIVILIYTVSSREKWGTRYDCVISGKRTNEAQNNEILLNILLITKDEPVDQQSPQLTAYNSPILYKK